MAQPRHQEADQRPYTLQTELAPWVISDGGKRRAGISSFGAGGANAHLIVEEHRARAEEGAADLCAAASDWLFVLSARRPELLRAYAERLRGFLQRHREEISAADLAYTLQVGRDEAAERLAIVARSVDELLVKLDAITTSASPDKVYRGQASEASGMAGFIDDDLREIARRWVEGARVDWEALYRTQPRRIWLPARPFEKRRHWPELRREATHGSGGASNGHVQPASNGERRRQLQEGVRRGVARISNLEGW